MPEVVELFAQGRHPGRIEPVNPASSHGFFADQAGVLEDLEVLRYGRSRDGELRRQITDGHRPRGEHQHDRPPRPIPERRPDVPLSVSSH